MLCINVVNIFDYYTKRFVSPAYFLMRGARSNFGSGKPKPMYTVHAFVQLNVRARKKCLMHAVPTHGQQLIQICLWQIGGSNAIEVGSQRLRIA